MRLIREILGIFRLIRDIIIQVTSRSVTVAIFTSIGTTHLIFIGYKPEQQFQ